jgi:thiol-disulfide isomerase/thioredoxin
MFIPENSINQGDNMKLIFIISLTYSILFAFQTGDTISKDIVKKLSLDKEKIYVIDFFASWCESCRDEIPYISKLKESGISIIGVDVDEDIEKGKSFQKELRDLKSLSFAVINDPKGEIVSQFDPVGIPALYIVKNAKIIDAVFGAKDNIDKIVLDKIKALK